MNFYKILNKEENHNGLQYKTGLNVDPLPWDPVGDCTPGGIYFSREDILAFIGYGPWLREVIVPKGVEVYENPGKPKKWKAHKVILGKRKKIDTSVIKSLLKEGANVHANDDCTLRWASVNKHLKTAELLLKHGANVHIGNDWALKEASINGHLEVVRLLIRYGANVHASGDWALKEACTNGHLKVVKFLIKHGADVHAANTFALKWASRSGHTEIVELLLKHGADQTT